MSGLPLATTVDAEEVDGSRARGRRGPSVDRGACDRSSRTAESRARWAACIAGRDEVPTYEATVQQGLPTAIAIGDEGEQVGHFGGGTGGRDLVEQTAVIERLRANGLRISLVIEEPPEESSLAFPLELDADVVPYIARSGQVILFRQHTTIPITDESGVVTTTIGDDVAGVIDSPWAVDANGELLRTWFEIEDGALVQHLDLSEAGRPQAAVATRAS